MSRSYEPEPYEISGIELIGCRNEDGSITLGTQETTTLDDFPMEVLINGVVYTLRMIRRNSATISGSTIEWGEYE